MKRLSLLIAVLFAISLCQCKKDDPAPEKRTDVLYTAYVDTPSGLRMRTQIGGEVISTLSDTAELLVLEEGKEETIDDQPGKWLRVEAEGSEGWVFGGFTSANRPDVQTSGRLMVRNVHIDDPRVQPHNSITVYLAQGGKWMPYSSIFPGDGNGSFGYPSHTVSLADIDNSGTPDIIVSGDCCGNGFVSVVLSNADGSLSTGTSIEGCEQGMADQCKGIPQVQSTGACDQTIISMGESRYAYSCNTGTFIEAQ
ncbi:SH3 domain-containing protein [Leptonema illini]|uniref:SH3 type 3 domain protein n=1 Tax=Leptonema illini DSM 21528 TaxID=929563 RepID=H2CIL4_9LEPT|nr:SH3 domain-containing protein [Leptonema illini]EHQ07030.1 hypothetical protein Lepil_2354 [Leptonema illini DSM 21528]